MLINFLVSLFANYIRQLLIGQLMSVCHLIASINYFDLVYNCIILGNELNVDRDTKLNITIVCAA